MHDAEARVKLSELPSTFIVSFNNSFSFQIHIANLQSVINVRVDTVIGRVDLRRSLVDIDYSSES
jgi:hypothetical protein